MNLFWSTRSLTDAREDHLTEWFAAALDVCPKFRAAYYNLVIVPFAKRSGWSAEGIQRVETQRFFEGTTCCPDVILHLSNGKTIACEHKLEAIETMGPAQDPRLQLERYLDLPIDGLVYVRNGHKPPTRKVLNHPKYIRPIQREHFLWRDFYPILSAEAHILLTWIQEGFDRLGFTPPLPSIGELKGPNEEENQRNCRNFAKLWDRTRSLATNLGWTVIPGSIVELYLSENPKSFASWIFISPAKADRFLVRVTPLKRHLTRATTLLQNTLQSLSAKADLAVRQVKRKAGVDSVIDVTTSLREVIGATNATADEIETRLFAFVAPLLKALQR